MKVVFDFQIFAQQSYGGISRYFMRLSEHLLAMGHDAHVVAPVHINRYLSNLPKQYVCGREFEKYPRRARRLVRWAQKYGSRLKIATLKPDILHETYYRAKPVSTAAKAHVITVYDMIHELFPEEFSPNDPASRYKRAAVQRADHIICISHNTKRDLCRLFNISPDRVSVIHLAYESFPKADPAQSVGDSTRPYILYVGPRGGYKNFQRLLEALASDVQLHSQFDLIAFGGGAFSEAEMQNIQALGFSDGAVRQVSGGDEVLGSLYAGARAFVYPSVYEGFGLPPLEAMAQGCPVVSSNSSSMPEVVGDAGEYFNPLDIEAQASAIRSVVFDDQRRADLIRAGTLRIQQFSWKHCAQETLQVYEGVLRQKASQ